MFVIFAVFLVPLWAVAGWQYRAAATWPKRTGVVTKRELAPSPAEGTEWRITVQYYFDHVLYEENPTFGHYISSGFNRGDDGDIVVNPRNPNQIILDIYPPRTFIIVAAVFSFVVLFLSVAPYLVSVHPR